jgi:chromate reductase
MKITIVSGSARENNNTIRVALALKKMLEQAHEVQVIDFNHYDIPFLSQGGFKPTTLTEFQAHCVTALDDSNLILFVSPEYNWSTTPELLNLLHCLGTAPFKNALQNKVFSFVGVSTGKGGKAPAIQLMQIVNKLIGFSQTESIVSAKIFEVHFVKEVLDENGNSLGNQLFDNGFKEYLNYTLDIAKRWLRA